MQQEDRAHHESELEAMRAEVGAFQAANDHLEAEVKRRNDFIAQLQGKVEETRSRSALHRWLTPRSPGSRRWCSLPLSISLLYA